MTITPVELHHISFRRRLRGYSPGAVDRVIEEIADSFEEVWRQRADFADRIEQLENELGRHRDLETLLRTTLVSAEKSAHELQDQARREAGIILAEARKIRALLEAALDAAEDATDAQAA